MDRNATKVFFSCALGAGIGSLVALEMSSMFWWLGLLVGGLVGYISYELKKVVKAVPTAFRATIGYQSPLDWEGVLLIKKTVLAFWTLEAIAMFLLVFFTSRQAFLSTDFFLFLMMVVVGGTVVFSSIFLIAAFFVTTDAGDLKRLKETCEGLLFMFALHRILLWHLPRGIIWLTVKMPAAVMAICMAICSFAKRFGWELFIRIHSEIRLLCGVDAMIGAGIGYLAGSALIGALAGGVVGLINYAVVTKRWLKPAGYLSRA